MTLLRFLFNFTNAYISPTVTSIFFFHMSDSNWRVISLIELFVHKNDKLLKPLLRVIFASVLSRHRYNATKKHDVIFITKGVSCFNVNMIQLRLIQFRGYFFVKLLWRGGFFCTFFLLHMQLFHLMKVKRMNETFSRSNKLMVISFYCCTVHFW
jgi:hypothetical protein